MCQYKKELHALKSHAKLWHISPVIAIQFLTGFFLPKPTSGIETKWDILG